MKDVLKRTLEAIEKEMDYDDFSDKTSELVNELISIYGRRDLVRRLFEDIGEEVDWKIVVGLISFLTWETPDVVNQLCTTTDKWLEECNDIRKVKIGLNKVYYPFTTKGKMTKVLTKVAQTYPEVAEQCKQLIDSRRH